MSRDVLFDHYRTAVLELVEPTDEVAFGSFERNYEPFLPKSPNAAILDLGCGSGAFLRYLSHKGFEDALGLEISREQADYCLAIRVDERPFG